MSLSSSAMLVDLNISVWTARKLDRQVSEEVDVAKNTQVKAGNYNKHLMAGAKQLEDIQKLAANIRIWHYRQTLPWSDLGSRLLPTKNFFDYKNALGQYEQEFDGLVNNFCNEYDTLVTAMAFQLGDLFNPQEYPPVGEIRNKFKFTYTFSPVPDAGDFRIDAGEAEVQELREQYENTYKARTEAANKDLWDRLYECLKNISEKLVPLDTPRVVKGRKIVRHGHATFEEKEITTQIFRDSLITNTTDLCDLLTRLNVTNDPKLEQARKGIEAALSGVSAAEIRKDDDVRDDVKAKVDEILAMF